MSEPRNLLVELRANAHEHHLNAVEGKTDPEPLLALGRTIADARLDDEQVRRMTAALRTD
jgi:hypothetical protein